MKNLISFLLVIAMIVTATSVSAAKPESDTYVSSELNDRLVITKEERLLRNDWEKIFDLEGVPAIAYDHPYEYIPANNKQALTLLPNGATPILFERDDTTIQVVYSFDNVRFDVAYTPGNTMTKTVKLVHQDDSLAIDENEVYVNFDNKNRKSYNTKKLKEGATYSRTDEEIKSIREDIQKNPEKYKSSKGEGDSIIVPLEVMSTAMTVKLTKWFPGNFNGTQYYSGSWTFPALNNASRTLRVYSSRDYYVEKSKTLGQLIESGSYISAVGDVFNFASLATTKGLLNLASVLYSTYNYLEEATQPVPFQEYEYSWGNEGTVYDTTRENADVEVWSEWGTGRMNLGNPISGGGKVWVVTAPAFTEPSDLSETGRANHAYSKAQNVANIYNNNISVYGEWIHGRGQIGY